LSIFSAKSLRLKAVMSNLGNSLRQCRHFIDLLVMLSTCLPFVVNADDVNRCSLHTEQWHGSEMGSLRNFSHMLQIMSDLKFIIFFYILRLKILFIHDLF
jgi:hypothetical protein